MMNLCVCLGQNVITGTITNEEGKPLIGASVLIKGTINGTISNSSGEFELRTSYSFPLALIVSYFGYSNELLEVKTPDQKINIKMKLNESTLGEVVVTAASKFDERIVEAPVTIEKVGLLDLRNSASIDAYGSVANLKGVQANTGSLTFTSMNTRGFADMQNWRFVQLLDGMFANAPGLGYPLGGNSGPADIDIASIELVPGANSALYGANAFNGLLSIKTKDPFYYQGLSAYVKTGVTVQEAGGTNPLVDLGFRYATSFNDKWALKVNIGHMRATDWTANDESYYINTARSVDPTPFLSIPRNDPNFDAVNVYGDEVQAAVDLDGSGNTTNINRTGIKESDIVDYSIQLLKADASLHYRLTDNVEASYSFRFIQSDAILRHTTIYPLVNLAQTFHKFEVKSNNWNIRAYRSQEKANDSYAMLATGAFIETGRKSNEAWGADYGAAFRGEVPGLPAGDHDQARIFADRDMPSVESDVFQDLRNNTLSNPDITTGGSKFIDDTRLLSIEGNYDFTQIQDVLSLQVGGNFRRYILDSQGQLFNDGPLGFAAPIPVDEYGAFIQAGKKFAKNRIHLRGSIRADKHQDYNLALTPRLSLVAGLDKEKKHNIRASFQRGFRNPSPQEGYINLDIGPAILLGGSINNIKNFSYERPDGQVVNGAEIHSNLVTIGSFVAFLQGGGTDPSILQAANIPLLVQEKNTTWEVGYKGVIGGKLLIDVNYYNTRYNNLVVRLTTASPQAGRVYAVYTNIDDVVRSDGLGLGVDYLIGSGYKVGFNYTYTRFDAEQAVANNPGFLPSFNTPENRINASFSNYNVSNSNLGFSLNFKYWDAYTWQSPFGAGEIDAANVVDLALTYTIPSIQSMIKVGASNLLNQEYRTVYGGPNVGSIFFVSWTYDQMFRK
ncbi:MAG: TonB-dependent receptor [Bacteroidota bacterium]